MGCLFARPMISRSSFDMKPIVNSPVINVTGLPGSLFTTVSQTLAAISNFHVINYGELLRCEAAKITTLRGMRVSKILAENKNVPEELAIELLKEVMTENADAKGFILCDFPKTKKMDFLCNQEVTMPDKVIALQVADEIDRVKQQGNGNHGELGKMAPNNGQVFEEVTWQPVQPKVTERMKKEAELVGMGEVLSL